MPAIEGEDLRGQDEQHPVQTEGPEVVDDRDTDPEVVAHSADDLPYCAVAICPHYADPLF